MNIDQLLEAASADCFWVPDDVKIVEREAIKYTSSPSAPQVHNRVLRVRPTPASARALVDEVIQAHGGGPSRWMLNPMSDTPGLRELLGEAGYRPGDEHYAYAIETARYTRRTPDIEVRRVQTIGDLRTLYALLADIFGGDFGHDEAHLRHELANCTGPRRRVARFVAYRNGEPAGTGGMTFFDEHSFALIWAGAVRPEHRGHGAYTALLAARAREAASRGVARMGLYARVDTSAPIVAAHGFERYGHMLYLDRYSS